MRDLLLVILLGLPLVTPLFRWTSVACTHDGHLHYHRVAAIRHAWENGLYFSRWVPDLAYGYGYPFFVYREPLPLYLTHFLHLAGLPLPAAENVFYTVTILAAGCFTYLWVRDFFGPLAAIVAAVAYMAAPYQLADALVRGNQVESIALALFPLLLWAGRRFIIQGGPSWYLIAVVGLMALSLSHNISLLIFTPTLLVYLLVVARLYRLGWRSTFLRLALLFVLGLGATGFYTGTALLEMDEVTLTLSTTTRNNDFRFNFATFDEILAPVTPENPDLLNPPLLFRLGWIPTALALIGVLSAFRNHEREQRVHVLLMAAAAALYLYFALAISRPAWENLPLIEFVQFPWRFVGRAALPVAVLAGAPFATGLPFWHRPTPRLPKVVFPAVAILLLALETVPNLYPNYCREEAFPTILTVHSYEHLTGLVGVDPEGSYFPRTVEQRPVGSPLETDYVSGREPRRFDTAALPPGAQLLEEQMSPTSTTVTVRSPVDFEARYLSFAFPGWTATIDGAPATITPSQPEGLITFPVPAGTHTVNVQWSTTPLRLILGGISLLCMLGILGTAFWLKRNSRKADPLDVRPQSLDRRSFIILALVGGALLAGKLLIIDRLENPLRRAQTPPVTAIGGLQAGQDTPELRLAGYNLSREKVPSGETFNIDLAWQTLIPPATAYQSNIWLTDANGLVWSAKETYRPRQYEDPPATPLWPAGSWAWDSREVQLLSGTPPGIYNLVLTLFELDTLQPLTLLSDAGAVVGPTALIGQVEVLPAEEPADFSPQFPTGAEIEGLNLLGYNQDRAEAAPGDPLLLTLFWEKSGTGAGYPAELAVTLEDSTGKVVQTWQLPPVETSYPPANWPSNARLRGQHLLRLSAALETDVYRFRLGDIPLGELRVNAPDRLYTAPAFDEAVDTDLSGVVSLAGYTLDCRREESRCELTLVWQALDEIPASYHVFVHLVDEAGNILAQSDAQPVAWQRPTTGWAPGEFIVDPHVLDLPADLPAEGLKLRVGLYDPDSGTRLTSASGAGFVELTPLSQISP